MIMYRSISITPHLIINWIDLEEWTRITNVLLTQLVLPRVACKLDDQQVSALHAASNAVNMRDVGTLGRRPLQQVVHLSVGGVGELYDGAGLLRGQTGPGYLLSGWKKQNRQRSWLGKLRGLHWKDCSIFILGASGVRRYTPLNPASGS